PRSLIGPPVLRVSGRAPAPESHLARLLLLLTRLQREQVDRPAPRRTDRQADRQAGGGNLTRDSATGDNMAETKPKTSPKAIKFLFGGLAGMGATVFVQPLDLVKNRMQLSGQGTKAREYKTSFHALFSILKNEGVGGIYTGLQRSARQSTYPDHWGSTPSCLRR
ncbi:hypothetical protein PFLUV_G00171510, partial [Perca fluviatilis]